VNVKVKKGDLIGTVESASKAINSRSTMPILQSILLKAKGSTLHVVGTNLELAIEAKIDAEIEEEGSVCIDAKLLSDLTKKFSGDDIFIESDDTNITIRNLLSEFKIVGQLAEEFPELPKLTNGNKFSVNQGIFNKAIQNVIYCFAKEEFRPVFTGIYFEIRDKKLTLVSTDGYRLSKATIEDIYGENEISFIVPGKSLLEVNKIIKGDKIEIVVYANHVEFRTLNTTIMTRTIEGQYLNYKNVIPNLSQDIQIKVKRNDFIKALERTLILDNKESHVIARAFEDKIQLSSQSSIGKIVETILCKTEGEIEIAFNAKYILEVLNAIDDEEVVFKFIDKKNPILIEKDNFFNMTLPIVIKDASVA
jgi:DNA polymerase-3 subunit beta